MSSTSLIGRLSRVYVEATRNGKPICGFASPSIWDEYEAELRVLGSREKNNAHEYLFSSAMAAEEGFVNLLFMGIPLCRDPRMQAGVRFEVRGYEPNQMVRRAAAPARLGYREVGGPGARTTRPTQLAPQPVLGVGEGNRPRDEGAIVRPTNISPRAGKKDIWHFLLSVGRMKTDDTWPVAACRSHSTDAVGLWFKRRQGIEEFVEITGLEVLQNNLDLQQLWGIPDAWELGHHWGYDLLPVTYNPELLPKSANKQLSGIDLSPVQPAELQAQRNDADRKRTHRKQLRMLVNERVPSHLMGAEIVKVETTYNHLYVDVSVAGSEEPVRIPAARLWDANLTVPGCVVLYGGELPKVPLEKQHPLAGIILP